MADLKKVSKVKVDRFLLSARALLKQNIYRNKTSKQISKRSQPLDCVQFF